MPAISGFGGIDYGSLVDQLVAIEKSPEKAIQKRTQNAQTRLSTLGDLSYRFQNVQGAIDAFNTSVGSQPLVASSNDTSRVTVSGTPAATGSYAISVGRLATAQTSRSSAFASSAPGAVQNGTLAITVGNSPAVSVSYGPADEPRIYPHRP